MGLRHEGGAGGNGKAVAVLRRYPAAFMALCGMVLCVALHLSRPDDLGGLVADLAALACAAFADRFVLWAGLSYMACWVVTLVMLPASATSLENLSFIPVLAAGLQQRYGVRTFLSVTYVLLLAEVWRWKDAAVVLRHLVLSIGMFAVIWFISDSIVQARREEKEREQNEYWLLNVDWLRDSCMIKLPTNCP